jgi:hypothetical protein
VQATRRLFLTLLAATWLAAFASLWLQIEGLIGSRGIAPVADLLAEAESIAGASRFWRLPTLVWLWPSDAGLHALCAAGVAAALLLGAGIAPRASLAVVWLAYLSLVSVGNLFLRYQWDSLLLETGFLAFWLAPWRRASEPVEPIAVWLLRCLLFKLMFLSGAAKLLSGDETWRQLTAMGFHYFTQPLPSPVSWYAHHLPEMFHRVEAAATLAIELFAPLLIFGPRRARLVAFVPLAGLQLLIGLTGNYGFFNLLTLSLCVLLLDDRALARLLPRRASRALAWRGPAPPVRRGWPARRVAFAGFAACLLALSALRVADRLELPVPRPAAVAAALRLAAGYSIVSEYGLFARMTTTRDEIQLEGSDDGETWRAYRFRYKPGPETARPRFTGLHLPRLDWEMWFASLRGCSDSPWFHVLLYRVLTGEPSVLALLAENPFPDRPPRYLRTRLERYTFAPPGDAAWWRSQPLGPFCPTVIVEDGELRPAAGYAPGAIGET